MSTDDGSQVLALDPAAGAALARSGTLDLSTLSQVRSSPDGQYLCLASQVDQSVTVLSTADLSVVQRLRLPLDSESTLAICLAGPDQGAVFAAQSGDFTDPNSRPGVTLLMRAAP